MAGVGRRPRWEWRGIADVGRGGREEGKGRDGGKGDAKDTGREAMEGVKWEGKGEGKVQASGRGGGQGEEKGCQGGGGEGGNNGHKTGMGTTLLLCGHKIRVATPTPACQRAESSADTQIDTQTKQRTSTQAEQYTTTQNSTLPHKLDEHATTQA